MKLAIDCRLRFGVETLLRNVVPIVAKATDTLVLVGDEPRLTAWLPGTSNVQIVHFESRVYGVDEQVRFPYGQLRDCDLLHVPNYNVPLAWRKPLVTTINDLAHLSGAMSLGWAKRRYAASMIGVALRRSRRVLTLSEFSRQELLRVSSVSAEKITVAHCGVDRRRFRPASPEMRRDIVELLGSDVPFILVCGSLRPHKNVNTLLMAFQQLKETYGIPHQLVVVGQQTGFRTNDPMVPVGSQVSSAVRFMGYLPEETKVQLYSFCSVFVFPSLYEGFGLPPLEAMACGAPVVCSNRASLPEVVGDAALLVDAADVDALARGIFRVIGDTRLQEELSSRGLKRAEMFSWEAMAQEYLRVYHECLRVPSTSCA